MPDNKLNILFLQSPFLNEYSLNVFSNIINLLDSSSVVLSFCLFGTNDLQSINLSLDRKFKTIVYVPFGKKQFKRDGRYRRLEKRFKDESSKIMFPSQSLIGNTLDLQIECGIYALKACNIVLHISGEISTSSYFISREALEIGKTLLVAPGNIFKMSLVSNYNLLKEDGANAISIENIEDFLPVSNLHDILKQ